jgi:GT2 family glycosyltransferase/tetratricopeptide (TPR) repeat protein
LLASADAARDRGDWKNAAAAYARVLAAQPQNAAIWVQYGHALKESGSREEAERAYARAVSIRPGDSDARLQHGHALKLLGRRADALAAFADALRIDPGCRSAEDELVRSGARDLIDDSIARAARLDNRRALATSARRAATVLNEAARYAPHPQRNHDEFRRDFPIVAPPQSRPWAEEVLFLIDAHDAIPALLRSTLTSLIDQTVVCWRAIVVGSEELATHPVASFERTEARISFDSAANIQQNDTVVVLTAGTILDPQALAWLIEAIERTGTAAVYSDHDHGREHWNDVIERWSPAFYWMYDPDFFAATEKVPATVLAHGITRHAIDLIPVLIAKGGEELRRALLLAAADHGGAAHVPRLLATKLSLPELSLLGKDDPPANLRPRPVSSPPRPRTSDASIHVIIPTRDEAELLDRCVTSLRNCATSTERVHITVVDNRSEREDTRRMLADGVAAKRFEVRAFDEPFNWSRANNLAAANSEADILLFLNNDTEMLTEGWDGLLRDCLSAQEIGAVGARLLYPDGSVQHAGILFGVQDGLPVHEALGAPASEAGPLKRWVTRRRVSAVTGACLAIRRECFERIGCFDERQFFVAYNDVDLCFRLREAGLAILYEPAIELVHHESKSRGHALTKSQIAWDHAERETLHRRWGATLFAEPSYNPHWPRRGAPFDGICEPTMGQILTYLERSAEPFPWATIRRDTQGKS